MSAVDNHAAVAVVAVVAEAAVGDGGDAAVVEYSRHRVIQRRFLNVENFVFLDDRLRAFQAFGSDHQLIALLLEFVSEVVVYLCVAAKIVDRQPGIVKNRNFVADVAVIVKADVEDADAAFGFFRVDAVG